MRVSAWLGGVGLSVLLASCSAAPTETSAGSSEAPQPPSSGAAAQPASSSSALPPAAATNGEVANTVVPAAAKVPPEDANALYDTLFRFIATHCYADEIGPSSYTKTWLSYKLTPDKLPADAHFPLQDGKVFPRYGQAATARAAELREAWLKTPRSHIIDCAYDVETRHCPTCAPPPNFRPRGARIDEKTHYVAYLPAALFSEPSRVRALLVLVPGGNGGRSRPFLTPHPDASIWKKGSGGLETQQRVDRYLAAHPETVPPIVMALQTAGEETPYGPTDYLTLDVPAHTAKTLLGGVAQKDLVVGYEGISSGSRAMVRAFFQHPDVMNTVGLSCLACGGVNVRTGVLGSPKQMKAWSERLAERRRDGDLQIRFAIGSRDNQLPCNRELHSLMQEAGFYKSPDEDFFIYQGELHNYNFLIRAYPDMIDWHLATLTDIHAHRGRSLAGASPGPTPNATQDPSGG